LDSQRVPLPEGNEYILLTRDGELWAGIAKSPAGTAPFWQVYFHVDDTSAAVEAAQAQGATIAMQPTYEDDVGTITVLVDPQGAVFGLNTPPS
jgi:predicted enzyme related to lactoylglutathione lyase